MNESQLNIVKENGINKPDNHELDYLLEDIIKDCRKMYFHTLEYTLVYDNKFTKISNNDEVNFIVTHTSLEFKTEIYGLNKKIKYA